MTIENKQYTIGGIRFNVNFLCPLFQFSSKGESYYFEKASDKDVDWTINFNSEISEDISDCETVFIGSDKFDIEMPFKWSVTQINNQFGLSFEFENDPNIKKGIAKVDKDSKIIDISLALKNNHSFDLDPFIYPLGILLLQYIAYLNKGFVIHASTVKHKDKGYLFSAISGTGKSTMANIWKSIGATIINDDRLLIMPDKDGFRAYNTPMAYYQDTSKNVLLHKVFIIKQSPNNYIKQLPTLQGTLSLLGNCMQFQYNEDQIQQRIDTIHTIAEHNGIYECGFKPDTDITKLILEELG